MLGGIAATLLVLLLLNLVWALVRRTYFAATGASVILDAKDGGIDDPARGILVPLAKTGDVLDRAAFHSLASPQCPLHNAPYVGHSRFVVERPGRPIPVYVVSIIGCTECLTEAQKCRFLEWRRDNTDEHPVWASRQLYPYLIDDRIVRLQYPLMAFKEDPSQAVAEQWIASPEAQSRSEGALALQYLPSERTIRLLKPLLQDRSRVKDRALRIDDTVQGVVFRILDHKGWGLDGKELRQILAASRAAEDGGG